MTADTITRVIPNKKEENEVLDEEVNEYNPKLNYNAPPRKYEILKLNVFVFIIFHISAFYGLYLCVTNNVKWQTYLMTLFIYIITEIGLMAGAHRLWAHRSYKAKLPLQILLAWFNCFTFQNSALYWARDHRIHHKFSDTDADPHNATRGFFYSHMGWLMVKKHPEMVAKFKTVDLSDLYSNKVLQWQRKNVFILTAIFAFIVPIVIPVIGWGETFKTVFNMAILRIVLNWHGTFFINSLAHKYGYRSYDKGIYATQNFIVSITACGEGFHNYHHVFPWDYRTAELGNNSLNLSAKFIDLCAAIGWAYDLKTVNTDIVMARQKRTGDGTDLWGFGDPDMTDEHKKNMRTVKPKTN